MSRHRRRNDLTCGRGQTAKVLTLYHATRDEHLSSILMEGLLPRAVAGRGNHGLDNPLCRGLVYLTDSLTRFYLLTARREPFAPVLIEVEVDVDRLLPDQNYLGKLEWARLGRDPAELRGSTARDPDEVHREICEICRAIDPRDHRSLWADSLLREGCVAHDGSITVEQITRAVVLPQSHVPILYEMVAAMQALGVRDPIGEVELGQDITRTLAVRQARCRDFFVTWKDGSRRHFGFEDGVRTLITRGPGGWQNQRI